MPHLQLKLEDEGGPDYAGKVVAILNATLASNGPRSPSNAATDGHRADLGDLLNDCQWVLRYLRLRKASTGSWARRLFSRFEPLGSLIMIGGSCRLT